MSCQLCQKAFAFGLSALMIASIAGCAAGEQVATNEQVLGNQAQAIADAADRNVNAVISQIELEAAATARDAPENAFAATNASQSVRGGNTSLEPSAKR